jgi:SAM-dependent methyltransferase
VRERFDREPGSWQTSHEAPVRDIIAWEVARRKQLALEALRERFGGRPARILEVGCGAGDNLLEIARADPAWTAVGVDISPKMVEHCRQRFAADTRLRFEVLDVEERSLAERFDAILLLGVVGYFDSTAQTLSNVDAMLEPGGLLVFTFGRRPSLTRSLRRAYQRLGGWLRGAPPSSHFRCLTDREVRESLPEAIEVRRTHHLAFGSGVLGPASVAIGRILERVFEGRDPLRLALTGLIVADKTPGQELPSGGPRATSPPGAGAPREAPTTRR